MRTEPRWRDESGQTLAFVALALPVLLLVASLLVDVGGLFLEKRSLQNRADAAALAAAPFLDEDGYCVGQCLVVLNDYNKKNKDRDAADPPPLTPCTEASPWNCYVAPHNGSRAILVKLKEADRPLRFAGAATLGKLDSADVTARAVAGLTEQDVVTTNPDQIQTTTGPDEVTTITGPDQVTTTTVPGQVVTTTIPGSPGPAAVAFAKSTDACSAGMHISGQDNHFDGAVVSNSGVDSADSNGGPLLVYNKNIDASKCVKLHGGSNWAQIQTAEPIDWPVPPPTCTPACIPANAGKVITSVGGVPCINAGSTFSPTTTPAPGLYCASDKVNISKANLVSTNVGYIAPTITLSGGNGTYSGNTSLLSKYGGLLFYAYGDKINASGSGNTLTGAMFAPFGNAQVSGASTSSVTGFIEGDTVQLSGGGGTWHGLGPGYGGTPPTTTTTTTPPTTTVVTTPGTTTTVTIPGPVTTTTTPGQTVTTTQTTSGLHE